MSYKAEISTKNPGCFIFLVNESATMEDLFGGPNASTNSRKREELATILNSLFAQITIRCTSNDTIRDYFHVGLVGYSRNEARSVFSGDLAGQDLVPIKAIRQLQVVDKFKTRDDSGVVAVGEQVKWTAASRTSDGTPMCAALREAQRLVKRWTSEHPTSYPPIVINVTDAPSTDGDPVAEAKALRSMSTEDGNVLLLNVHLSAANATPVELPSDPNTLKDDFARKLFEMSSQLTPHMVARARELGLTVDKNARGFVFNAQPTQVVQLLDIGTRPTTLQQ